MREAARNRIQRKKPEEGEREEQALLPKQLGEGLELLGPCLFHHSDKAKFWRSSPTMAE